MIRAIVVAFLLATPTAASAAIIEVFPDGSGDVPTIAEALAVAGPSDTISLGAGTFYERDLVWQPARARALLSQTGDPATTFIDAQNLGRCIDITNNGQKSVVGITFINGTSPAMGGLVKGDNAQIRFRNCVFRNGTAQEGGAVGVTPGVNTYDGPSFSSCLFENNSATLGGALFIKISGLFDCTLRNNTATIGGAVYSEKHPFEFGSGMYDCIFTDNEATESGGAIYSTGDQPYYAYGTFIDDCEFRGNNAADAGAVRLHGHDFLNYCSFFDNEATNSGGAVYMADVQPDEGEFEGGNVAFNVVAGNAAAVGGGVVIDGGRPYFYGNTLSGNRAALGANLSFRGNAAPLAMQHCILAFGIGGAAAAGAATAVQCFDVYGNEGGDWVGPLAGQLGMNGNFAADPLFCNPGDYDFTLQASSPCYPGNHPNGVNCGLIGALGQGCVANAVQETSWGQLKALFR